jgi:hypothetical protein
MKKPATGFYKIFRIVALLLAAVFIIPAASCAKTDVEPGPDDAVILARLNELVPLSLELNEIFIGEGLKPTDKAVKSDYDVGSEYFEVADDAPYHDMASLKAAAEQVYSAEYLKSVYIMAFEGSDAEKISPRYKDVGGKLFVDIAWKSLELNTKLDLSSAKITESTASKVKVSVNYTLEGDTGSGGQMTLVLVNQDGVWLLDGPTF